MQKYVRGVAHTFHTTSSDDIFISGEDALRGKHDRLHAAGADLVDSGSIGSMLHPGSERDLASWRLTYSSLNNVSEENLLDFLGGYVILVECMLQGDGAEFCGGERFEGAVKGAYWSPGCSDDDCFPRAERRLENVSF